MKASGLVLSLFAALTCAACASDITEHAASVELREVPEAMTRRLLTEVEVRLAHGVVRRPLRAGSRWSLVGTTPEGTVYEPLDGSLMVRTGHSYEAWIVLAGGALVGVYLPVENSFVATQDPIPLEMELDS